MDLVSPRVAPYEITAALQRNYSAAPRHKQSFHGHALVFPSSTPSFSLREMVFILLLYFMCVFLSKGEGRVKWAVDLSSGLHCPCSPSVPRKRNSVFGRTSPSFELKQFPTYLQHHPEAELSPVQTYVPAVTGIAGSEMGSIA